MNSNKRAEFEAIVTDMAKAASYSYMDLLLTRFDDGGDHEYRTTWVSMMWNGWCAALNHITDNLPAERKTNHINRDITCENMGFNDCLGEIKQVIGNE